jgi:serine/threonine-protein kinase RsbT
MVPNIPLRGELTLERNLDVAVCRQKARQITQALNFTVVGQTMLVTAVSELARNAVIYGGGGTVMCEVVAGPGIKVGEGGLG